MMFHSRHAAFGLILAALTMALLGSSTTASGATLGETTIGGAVDTGDSNFINGSRYTTPSIGGTVSSISVYVGAADATPMNKYQVAIYSDSGGKPATLIASSGSGTLSANAWNTLPITANLQGNTPYWLMYNANGASPFVNNLKYKSGGTDAYSQGSIPFGTWPATFGPSVLGGLQFSIYATYTPSAADTIAPSAPAMLSATGGVGSASLTWGAATDNVGVTGYAVYRSTTSGFVPGPSNRVGQTTGTTFTDSGLAAGLYYYVVTASDAAGNVSPRSNQASATVTAGVDPRATVGEWASPVALPNVMQHAVLLPGSSRILYFESGAAARVLDATTGMVSAVPVASNLFCAGQTLLADGRVIVIGGDTEAMGTGLVDTNVFDPATNGWTRMADMAYRRWYPTATRLPNGRIFALSGSADGCTSCIAQIPEVFDPATNTWARLTAATANIPYYPFVYVLPNGRLVQVGATEAATSTQVLDLTSQTWSTIDARLIDAGSSAMYRPGQILKAGTASDGNTPVRPSSASAYIIDMTAPTPTWQATGSMANPRAFLNLTPLPDGHVLATGGESTADGTIVANAVKAAEWWSPATGQWSTLASANRPRLYHSVALLLPDGRVLVGGSGNDGAVPTELNYEIFSPPYLFKGQRPTITLAPGTVGYAQTFTVSTPDAARIASVALIAPAAVTHSFDENAHHVPLSFTLASGALQVQAPANANLAPPGDYMLFIVDSSGVPSVSTWLRVKTGSPDATPPTAPGTLGASGGVASASLTWGPATDNVGVTLYNVHRASSSGFTISSANRIGQSTSTTFNDSGLAAGTYYYRVTASDAAGNTGPPSNESSTIVSQGSGSIALERTVSTDVLGTAVISGLNTGAPNDLLLAFISADGPDNQSQTASVSGAGLTWTLVRRTNTQSGSAEVWQALAPSPLVNASVQSVLSQSGYRQSLTVAVLSGAARIGATAGASAQSGGPSAQILTTAAGAWVFGIGNDYDSATARTLGSGQTMIHQWLETSLGDTYWVQRLASPVAASGSAITINDTAPTNDRWNLTVIEVVPR
ncbi:MAG: DUF1929 domain-containing protein [Burkholderiales bacterium]|nr:DUF1929 domain-containing protein [Burkholderiales bacterium]